MEDLRNTELKQGILVLGAGVLIGTMIAGATGYLSSS